MPHAVKIADLSELAPGDKKLVEAEGLALVLVRIDDEYHAVDDVCTHDGEPLGEGDLDGCQIECPRHGARFDVRTGEATQLPAIEPIATYPVEVREDGVYVRLGD